MAYNTQILLQTAKEIIKKYKPHNLMQLIALIGISPDTFYVHFPLNSKESEEIKKEIQLSNAEVVAATLNKTFTADTPSDRAMILKIYGGEEMRKKLSTNYNEISGEGNKEININVVVDEKKTTDTLDKLRNGEGRKTDKRIQPQR